MKKIFQVALRFIVIDVIVAITLQLKLIDSE